MLPTFGVRDELTCPEWVPFHTVSTEWEAAAPLVCILLFPPSLYDQEKEFSDYATVQHLLCT